MLRSTCTTYVQYQCCIKFSGPIAAARSVCLVLRGGDCPLEKKRTVVGKGKTTVSREKNTATTTTPKTTARSTKNSKNKNKQRKVANACMHRSPQKAQTMHQKRAKAYQPRPPSSPPRRRYRARTVKNISQTRTYHTHIYIYTSECYPRKAPVLSCFFCYLSWWQIVSWRRPSSDKPAGKTRPCVASCPAPPWRP